MRPLSAFVAAVLLVSSASVAAAQEIQVTGPLAGACPAPSVRYSVPARLEWAYWIGAGMLADSARDRSTQLSAFVSAGYEVTIGVTQWVGFPASPSSRPREESWRGADFAELRVGTWAQGERRSEGGLVEGGLTMHLGTVNDDVRRLFQRAAPWGMFDLRVGAGYGSFPGGRSREFAVAVAWGTRFVFDRGSWGLPCDDPPPPDAWADATLVRLVATIRRATDVSTWEGVLGIEISPTMALVPTRLEKKRQRSL